MKMFRALKVAGLEKVRYSRIPGSGDGVVNQGSASMRRGSPTRAGTDGNP